MTKTSHLVLKFKNKELTVNGESSDTINEHMSLCENLNKLIWGQSSNKKISGLSEKNRKYYKEQIKSGINTYVFFITNVLGKKEVFVGELCDIYDIGEIQSGSSLTKYIPNYYSSSIGTKNDINNLFVEVKTFIKIDSIYLDNIIIKKSGEKLLNHKSSTPVLPVKIEGGLEEYIKNLSDEPTPYSKQELLLITNFVLDEANEYPEGRVYYAVHRKIERNSNLIKDAKELFMKNHNGRLYCETCGFDFVKIYGDRGINFIEGHHTKQVSLMKAGEKTKLEDIAMLCSNCHSMIHRKPLVSVEELSMLVNVSF
jgi:ribosomal protein S27AE